MQGVPEMRGGASSATCVRGSIKLFPPRFRPCQFPQELALQATAGASLPECPRSGRVRLQGKLLQ